VDALAGAFSQVRVGDPFDPATQMGPLVSGRQRDRVEGYIAKGVEQGAVLATGGGRPKDLDRGYYIEPTVFGHVDNSSVIAQEEIFGPVLVVIPYDGDEEAVRIANDSPYGLAGYVLSDSLDRSVAVARQLRAGSIGLNGGAAYGADVPFGGFKASGVGRQNGLAGFDQYLEVKSVAWPVD